MPLDPKAIAWLEELRAARAPSYQDLPPVEGRKAFDDAAAGLFGQPDPVASVEDTEVSCVPVRVYRPADGDLPGVVYLRGGGWVLGSIASVDGLCRNLAARSGCTIASVDYRLAPEHPFPAALDDAWAVSSWAAEEFPAGVAIAGDSAGGHLAAVSAMRARDEGLSFAAQVLVYPVTDYSFETTSFREWGEGTNLTEGAMRWFWTHFVPAGVSADDPRVSPLRAPELAGVAPALVISAECDPLCDEGAAYARRLEQSGAPVTLTRYDGQVHGFVRMGAVFDRAFDVQDQIAAALRNALEPPA